MRVVRRSKSKPSHILVNNLKRAEFKSEDVDIDIPNQTRFLKTHKRQGWIARWQKE
jgi:hypothetical protein